MEQMQKCQQEEFVNLRKNYNLQLFMIMSYSCKIVIKMPELLTLGDINTKVKIVPKNENLKATEGTIISSNVIEIEDVFGKDNEINMNVPLKLEFEIHSSQN